MAKSYILAIFIKIHIDRIIILVYHSLCKLNNKGHNYD
nr:MAG TPA: hypothetical protein [Bacteriophage sp.]